MKGLVAFGAFIAFIVLPGLASGSPISYTVTADTSSITGVTGSIDFQFNPGLLVTQNAQAAVASFAGGSIVDSPFVVGNVVGTLPGLLTFDNGGAFNDYFQSFTYGTVLTFELLLSGPALSAPDGSATSGSTFAFSMFSDPAGTIPAQTADQNGFVFIIELNLDGTVTPTVFRDISGAPVATLTPSSTPSPVPEPGAFALVANGLGIWLALRNRSFSKRARR